MNYITISKGSLNLNMVKCFEQIYYEFQRAIERFREYALIVADIFAENKKNNLSTLHSK